MATWRRLNFFSHTSAPAPELLSQATAWCALADGGLAVADAHGTVRLLTHPDLTVRATFAAHTSGVLHLVQPARHKLLLSFGSEPDGPVQRAYLKVWRDDVGRLEERSGGHNGQC